MGYKCSFVPVVIVNLDLLAPRISVQRRDNCCLLETIKLFVRAEEEVRTTNGYIVQLTIVDADAQ